MAMSYNPLGPNRPRKGPPKGPTRQYNPFRPSSERTGPPKGPTRTYRPFQGSTPGAPNSIKPLTEPSTALSGRGVPEGSWDLPEPSSVIRNDPYRNRASREHGQGPDINDLLSMLFGDQGQVDTSGIAGAYDKMLAAQQGGLDRIIGLTNERIGQIQKEGRGARNDIGGFFGFAEQAANKGKGAVRQSSNEALGNLDNIYKQADKQLSGIAGLGSKQASAAAGDRVSAQMGDRMQAAVAPFQAAAATDKAASKGNVTANASAGTNYLSQLAAAAPQEGAMNQAAITAREQGAVNNANLALAQQQAEVEMRMAEIEGQKQLAIIDATKDVGGSTMERMMQAAGLFEKLGADTSPLLSALGLQAAPGAGPEAMSPLEQQRYLMNEQTMQSRAADMSNPISRENALGSLDPKSQQLATNLMKIGDVSGKDALSAISDALALTTNNPEMKASSRAYGGTIDQYAIDHAGETGTWYTEADTNAVRELMRLIYS